MDRPNIFTTRFQKSYFTKMSALVLTFLLLFSPLVPVFAQEVTTDSTSTTPVEQTSAVISDSAPTEEKVITPQNDTVIDNVSQNDITPADDIKTDITTDPKEEKPIEDPIDEVPIEEEPEMMMSSYGAQEFNPENLTAGLTQSVKGILEPDQTTGALNYSFPIVVPPGRNGMQPDLALEYNNQQVSNVANIIGYGWKFNIPYIERVNKTGTDKLYTSDYFYSTLSGELVQVSSGVYAPKVENGNFIKYSFASNVWTLTDKNGTVYKFGTNAAERQDNPSDSSKIYKWMLQEVRDPNNNYVKYEYYKDGGQIYPDTITYTGNGSTDGIFEVEFTRESRSDINKSYATAFLVTTNYRIDEIITKVNGTWVKKYATAYTTGDAGSRSLLSSLIESGQDESSNVTTLPATSFTYYTSTAGWTTNTSSYTSPVAFGNGFQNMLDVNGDATPDIIESYNTPASPIKNTYLNNNDGTWSVNSGLQPSILFREYEVRGGAYQDQWDQGVRMGDVNGDLLPDIIKSEDNANSKGGVDAYLNTTGSSWTQSSGWNPTVTFNGDNNITTWGSHFIDLNGDGLTDIIKDLNGQAEQINTGTAFGTSGTAWNPPVDINGPNMQFADVNGDGLPDIIHVIWTNYGNTRTASLYLNKGDGTWVQDNSFFPPVDIANGSSNDTGVRFFDVNNDGLVDEVSQYNSLGGGGHGTYLNTGVGSWTSASSWNVPDSQINFNTSSYINIADLNADGSLDFLTTQNSSPMVTKAFINNTSVPVDTLKRVTFPQGGYSETTYKKSSKYVDGSGDILNPSLPIPFDTVYQISTIDGNGNTSTDTYSYEGGLYYYNTYADRKPAGFAKVTKTDSAGTKVITYFHQGNSTNSSQGEYSDDVSKIGKPYRIEVTDSSGNIYQKVINKWDKYNQGTGRDFVKLAKKTVLTYDGDSDHKDTATEYSYDDTYGNITTKTIWGEVTASDDGSFTDTGTDKSVETISYTTNTTDYIVGLPYQDTVVDQSSNKVRESKTYYDTQSLGTVTDGNITKVERWKTGSTYVNTQKAYNTTYGIPTSFTDERGKTTTYSDDSYNLYPATVTNPLSQAVSYTYDYSLGKPKQVTDQNSFVYQTVYDGLDRVKEEKVPDLSSPYSSITKTAYTYTDTSGAVSIARTDNMDASVSISSYKYFDGLNRLIQDRTETESSYAARDYVYNTIGKLYKESLPYASSGSSKTSPTGTTALYTTYTYDTLQRPLTVVDAIGTTSYAYDDWKTSITDARSKVKHYYKDAYNNLKQVDETNSGSTYTTTYEWDLNNNLTKITDALSNIRNFTYDGLSRRLTAEDLHASGDTTFGSWSYAYDDAGNMTQSVSPESKTVNYTYNDINQVLTENYTGDAGTEITYTYGGCTNGTGKLCNIDMLSGADTDYTYNSNGGIASEVKTINSNGYTTSYTYDRLGNQLVITYPDNAEVRYTYNTAGQLEKIERKESGGSYTDVVSDFDYGPHGKIVYQENLNDTYTENTFDADKAYRLANKKTYIYSNTLPSNDNPVIALTGSSLITLTVGDTWTEPGYSASDTEDGNITSSVTVTGSVNTAVAGNYYLQYNVVDSRGEAALQKIRTVVVKTPFTPSTSMKALVIGGGGGGGRYSTKQGAGGGAGGYKENNNLTVTAQSYTITVGAGGAGSNSNGSRGTAGDSSSFGSLLIAGGGGGGGSGDSQPRGGDGGSGGGGGSDGCGQNGNGTSGQGYNGGDAYCSPAYSAGGGGGAGGLGSDGSGGQGGNGGVGAASSITGSSVTRAGGGGGSGNTGGTGGTGGGGAGSSGNGNGSNAIANTGSGGGGAMGAYTGGNGGSGVVIISYVTADFGTCTGGTITTNGAYTVHTFNSSGTFTAVAASAPTNNNPVITLTGSTLNDLTVGDTWTEPGYSATDTEDGNLTGSVTVTGSVNTAVAGNYHLVYKVTDSQGLAAEAKVRTVIVHPASPYLVYGQNTSYTYDANNNITQIVDSSDTDTIRTVAYVYDDLNRMTSATATNVASGQSTYTYTYGYNAIGNITSGPVGSYVYNGSSGSNWANPHAATSINSVTNTYDKDGNMITDGTLTNTWNYKQQLLTSDNGTDTLEYWYDNLGNRVRAKNGTNNTYYANKFYNVDPSGNKTKSIYAGDILVANIETVSSTVSPYYVHTDHLGSTNVVTNNTGYMVELLDYYPYGAQRISSGSYTSQKKALGQFYDVETELNYYNARYMNGEQGRFISQDSSFLSLGDERKTRENTGKSLQEYLLDPQALNSYSYAGNNPINKVDNNGKSYWEVNASVNIQPLSGNLGFKIDFKNLRLDFTLGVGFAQGYSADLSGLYNPNNLPKEHTYTTTSAEATAGYLLVGKGSVESTVAIDKNNNPVHNTEISSSFGVGTGIGASVSASTNTSYALIDYSQNKNIFSSIATGITSTVVNTANVVKSTVHSVSSNIIKSIKNIIN